MTPREYYRESAAAQQRWRDEADRTLVQAWHTASFAMQALNGKLPALDVVLAKSRGESVRQTVEQQIAHLRTLSKSAGGRLRPVSPDTVAKLRPMRES